MSSAERADLLRQEFDQAFALPATRRRAELEAMLALALGDDHSFALPLGEVAALVHQKTITPVPGPLPELLGLAGFRGSLVPVYDLGALLGYAPTSAPPWMVLTHPPRRVALAFCLYQGDFRLPLGSRRPEEGRPHVNGVVDDGQVLRSVLDLRSLLDHIEERVNRG